MVVLIISCVILSLIISILVYRLSCGILTFSSWIYTQSIFLPFIGSVIISLYTNHIYFFIYIFLDLVFYFLGFLTANKTYKSSCKEILSIRTTFYNPLDKNILNMSISISFLVSILLLINYIESHSLFYENKNVLKVLISTSSYQRIFYNLYGGIAFETYAAIGLLLYNMYKEKKYLALTFISILIMMLEGFVFGSKAAAIAPVLSFAVISFYINKNYNMIKKYIKILIPISLFLTYIIVKHAYTGESGINPFLLILLRATTISIAPVYVIIYIYSKNNGFLYGKTFIWELYRIIGQIKHEYNVPLLSEIINDIINGLPTDTASRISAAVKVYGVGYANFGIIGAFAFSFIFGYLVQYFNLRLLTFKKVNIFYFILISYILLIFLGGLAESGAPLITLESFMLVTGPISFLLFIIYIIISLPFNKLKFKITRK